MTKAEFIKGLTARAAINKENRGGVAPRRNKVRPLKDLMPDQEEPDEVALKEVEEEE